MNRYTWSKHAFTALVLLQLSACGDDDRKKQETEPAQLGAAADGKIGDSDPEAVIDSLNSAEWKAACVDMAQAADARNLKHGSCIMGAILGKLLGQSCQELYDLCAKSEGDIDCDRKPTQCPVTLREADECITSNLVWLSDQAKGLTCDSSVNDLIKLDQNFMSPECTKVQTSCPDLMPEEEEVGF